jgi:hypothetical protein
MDLSFLCTVYYVLYEFSSLAGSYIQTFNAAAYSSCICNKIWKLRNEEFDKKPRISTGVGSRIPPSASGRTDFQDF